jgi:haloalkane dehalogenase
MSTQENMISAEFPYESQYVNVNGRKMHYIEAGSKDPTVLLLHGIPVNVYLWRNVIPYISLYARALAIDLIGFGKSDQPTDIDYTLQMYTEHLEGAIEALNLRNIVVAGMDLGLMVGLNYAMQHESNVKGLVMFEGWFQPMDVGFRNMSPSTRLQLRLFRIKQFAEFVFIKNDAIVEQFISSGTIRKLASEEFDAYRVSLRTGEMRRKVWMEEIGPHAIRPKSERAGDMVDLINRYAAKLSKSPIPKLLLYAEPGFAITEKSVRSARESVPNLEAKFIGQGKHFLPEDQPANVGQAIAEFCQSIG